MALTLTSRYVHIIHHMYNTRDFRQNCGFFLVPSKIEIISKFFRRGESLKQTRLSRPSIWKHMGGTPGQGSTVKSFIYDYISIGESFSCILAQYFF